MKIIPLYKGYRSKKQIVGHTIVDDDDFDMLNMHEWHYAPDRKSRGPGYARRSTKRDGVKLDIKIHREIMGLIKGDSLEVDHINRNTLDNRKCNLRIVTRVQQMQNVTPRINAVSSFRGVTFDRDHRSKPWRARAALDSKMHNIGRYATEEEAAVAVLKFRKEHMIFAVE